MSTLRGRVFDGDIELTGTVTIHFATNPKTGIVRGSFPLDRGWRSPLLPFPSTLQIKSEDGETFQISPVKVANGYIRFAGWKKAGRHPPDVIESKIRL